MFTYTKWDGEYKRKILYHVFISIFSPDYEHDVLEICRELK
jgi:hypothetical protein